MALNSIYGLHTPVSPGEMDIIMGRKFSPRPAHLVRAIYIPYHKDMTSHLPLYDISRSYHAAVEDSLLGSREFKLRLHLLKKPSEKTIDGDVAFLTNLDIDGKWLAVEERCMGIGQKADLTRVPGQNGRLTVSVTTPDRAPRYAIKPTCPLPSKIQGHTVFEYPYFVICSMPGTEEEPTNLEWQVHPVETGSLCYTLIDKSKDPELEESVRAIYHHAGLEEEMPNRYSEGVLLLPEKWQNCNDALVVSSLLGLLRFIRDYSRVQVKRSLGLGKLGKAIHRVLGDRKPEEAQGRVH